MQSSDNLMRQNGHLNPFRNEKDDLEKLLAEREKVSFKDRGESRTN